MKIYSATTNTAMTFEHWQDDTPIDLPAGTTVTAIELDSTTYHLNATIDGDTYTRYTSNKMITLNGIAATLNEG